MCVHVPTRRPPSCWLTHPAATLVRCVYVIMFACFVSLALLLSDISSFFHLCIVTFSFSSSLYSLVHVSFFSFSFSFYSLVYFSFFIFFFVLFTCAFFSFSFFVLFTCAFFSFSFYLFFCSWLSLHSSLHQYRKFYPGCRGSITGLPIPRVAKGSSPVDERQLASLGLVKVILRLLTVCAEHFF